MNYFRGKSFLVTGASGGIGRAVALELGKAGANVLLMARREDALEATRAAASQPDLSRIFAGDVTRPEHCAGAIDACVREFSGLDGLIQNAGVSQRSLAEETDPEVYRRLMDVNFMSMVNFYRPAIAELKKTRGHLVGVSSVQGIFSTQMRSGYAAAKHALQGFLDSVRIELRDAGVHVMTVSPGFVQTDISKNALGAGGQTHGKVDAATAAGLAPEHVARAILNGLRKRKRDVIPAGFKERFAVFLSARAPGLLDRILANSDVT